MAIKLAGKVMHHVKKRDVTPDDIVWLNIYCAVANLFNSDKSQAVGWADNGLAEYKKRFGKA